jgi:hypothetical protein
LHYGSTANGTTAVMALNSSDPYKFKIERTTKGYKILGKNAGYQGLVVRSNSKADAAYVEMRATNTTPGSTSAEWLFVQANFTRTVDDSTYFLRNASSGMYMDVTNGNTADATAAIQHKFNGSPSERFVITRDNNGYYSIKGVKSGKYLYASGTGIGSQAQIYSAKLGPVIPGGSTLVPSQLFRIVKNDSGGAAGSYRLVAKNSNLTRQVGNIAGKEGTNNQPLTMQQEEYKYKKDCWYLEKAVGVEAKATASHRVSNSYVGAFDDPVPYTLGIYEELSYKGICYADGYDDIYEIGFLAYYDGNLYEGGNTNFNVSSIQTRYNNIQYNLSPLKDRAHIFQQGYVYRSKIYSEPSVSKRSNAQGMVIYGTYSLTLPSMYGNTIVAGRTVSTALH